MGWKQTSGNEMGGSTGHQVWVTDGVLGFSRPLDEGETVEQAVADFERAGEPAQEIREYQDGEEV